MSKLVCSTSARLKLFVSIGMPIAVLVVMTLGGFILSVVLDGWYFWMGFDFMASAATGGALLIPMNCTLTHGTHDCKLVDPRERFVASMQGATGVALFGFLVAVLSHSILDPLARVLKLDDTGKSFCETMRSLGVLLLMFLIVTLLDGLVLGGIAAICEDWTFWEGFKTLINTQLGGGIQIIASTPKRHMPFIWFGTWAYGMGGALVAFFDGPVTATIESMLSLKAEEGTDRRVAVAKAIGKYWVLVLFIIPVALIVAMLVVACCLSMHAGPRIFLDSFWLGLPAVSGGVVDIKTDIDLKSEFNSVHEFALICAASVGFFILSSAINVGSTILEPVMDCLGFGKPGSVAYGFCTLFVSCFLLIPLLVYLSAIPVALLTAWLLEWPFSDAFWWCVSVQLGGGMVLTEKEVGPKDGSGRFVAVLMAAFSIGVSVFSVSLNSSPAVEPVIEFLGMTVSEENLQDAKRLENDVDQETDSGKSRVDYSAFKPLKQGDENGADGSNEEATTSTFEACCARRRRR